MAPERPYRFANLPQLSRSQVAVQQSMARHLAQAAQPPDLLPAVAAAVGQLTHTTCRLSTTGLQAVSGTALRAAAPALGCFLALAAAPGSARVLVDVDGELAAFALARLLGGDGADDHMQRPLTPIEAGVLSLVWLKVLHLTHGAWQTGRELALCLERHASRLEELGDWVEGQGSYQQFALRLALDDRQGYVRVSLPDSLLTERFGKALPQSGATPLELQHMRRGLAALGERTVLARLTISRLDLEPDDVANVEPGDIIVLENHQLTKSPDGIEGEVFVTLGRGVGGGFVGRLRNDESEASQACLEVVKIVPQEQPVEPMEEGAMSDGDGDDNLAETEGLLRDVGATVAVELGRIRMNTAQVVRLRSGQILRLTRGPNDPVDLVVNGKVFARGELIDVEGELGVRLTQVAGND